MDEKTNKDRPERSLVQISPDEFATQFNRGFWRSYQGLINREWILLALIVLGLIGYGLYRLFAG